MKKKVGVVASIVPSFTWSYDALSVYGQAKHRIKTVNRKVERKVTEIQVCSKCALFWGSIVILSLTGFMRC